MVELKANVLKPDYSQDFPAIERLTDVEARNFVDLQPRAQSAFEAFTLLSGQTEFFLLNGFTGVDYERACRDLIQRYDDHSKHLYDVCYAENLINPFKPIWLHLMPGTGIKFCEQISELIHYMQHHLDAEHLVTKILKKQNGDEKVADYLEQLSAHVAQNKEFQHPVLINLLIHHDTGQRPVLFARDLSWEKLFGSVNYQTEQGSVFSHHHLLEPGLVRQANGGYLVLPIDELLDQPHLWFKLRNAIAEGYLDWNYYQESKQLTPLYQPEATPLNISVILVGDRVSAAEISMLDREVVDIVSLRADLIHELDTNQYLGEFIGYLEGLRQKFNLADFDRGAIKALCRYASRLCEHQSFVSLAEAPIASLMKLASARQPELITAEDISRVLKEQDYRLNYLVEHSDRAIIDGQILLQTSGQVVGQINGLSVIEILGHPYNFGEPVRLTATVHLGEGELSDIERKAELAGQIHAKAMMIIHGYLSNIFGSENPSPLSGNLVFEQSYHEIDGDSASLTGLCAVLSALSHVPIYQHFAVTGAVDQFGNVQPVGGVNEKIEGFFRVCKIHGLNGKQGVILPHTNTMQLNLADEVIEAVEQGKFHLYPVEHVEEAIELLTGMSAGDSSQPNTLFGKIRQRLDELNFSENRSVSILKRIFSRT
ncbi:AAA family ATPase [Dongshaea marina]|uniref:AAA family ATPase n=1 Tax=Dongshaea marina TaxID=2047966 RepID=UPI000D3E159A|nr:AAA family ATPase [Dongshaea marina]